MDKNLEVLESIMHDELKRGSRHNLKKRIVIENIIKALSVDYRLVKKRSKTVDEGMKDVIKDVIKKVVEEEVES